MDLAGRAQQLKAAEREQQTLPLQCLITHPC